MKSQNSKHWIYITTILASSLLCLACSEKPSYECTVDSEFFVTNMESVEKDWDSIEEIQDEGYTCMLGKWVCPVGGDCENADKPQEKPCEEECKGLLQCIDGKCACPEGETCVTCEENCDEYCGRIGICVPTDEEIRKDGVFQGYKGTCDCPPDEDDIHQPAVTSICDCTGDKCIIKDTNQSCEAKDCDVDKNILVEYINANDEKKQIRAKCIENMQDLANISPNKSDNKEENAYILVNTISLTETYNPIGMEDEPKAFKGLLFGAGHKVQGTIKCKQDYCGIFSKLDDALINGINFESLELENTGNYNGVIAGEAIDSTILNITIDNTKDSSDDLPILHLKNHGGGIVGTMQNSIIKNVHIHSDIEAINSVGGVAGTITGSKNEISLASYSGKIRTPAMHISSNDSYYAGIVAHITIAEDTSESEIYESYPIKLDRLFSNATFIPNLLSTDFPEEPLPSVPSMEPKSDAKTYIGGIVGLVDNINDKRQYYFELSNSFSLASSSITYQHKFAGLIAEYLGNTEDSDATVTPINLKNSYFAGKINTSIANHHPIIATTQTALPSDSTIEDIYYINSAQVNNTIGTSFTMSIDNSEDTEIAIPRITSPEEEKLFNILDANAAKVWKEQKCTIPAHNETPSLLPVLSDMPMLDYICNK